jgi:eukaryotic-like serine/threonine-protein kinase
MQPSSEELKSLESKENSSSGGLGLPRSFERFKLLRRIARGGMGEIYLATSGGIEGAERPVVIKTIRSDHDSDSSFLARFLDEARIQSQLHHPGVAQILEAATDASGKPYVVVEYVEGRNLSDVRGRAATLGVRIEWPEALAFAINVGDALAHVHERTDAEGRPLDIVHRDLSPQNVMLGYGGDVKLIDFGTARGENRRCHTIAGVVFAKPGYVAPEVANNTPGGVPADLYAFGIMLWELCAGRRFLSGEPSTHLAAVGAGKKSPTPVAQPIGAPAELDRVIEKLTAVRIEDRYSSARQAVAELVRLLQRAPSLADGDRSVRGRLAHLMRRLYPAEPARSRAEFQALVASSKSTPSIPPPLPVSPPAPEASPSVLPGTRYRIERELGRGAMGVVYEAVHLDLGRRVALKVLDHECAGGEGRGRFAREARAVAKVSHEGLVGLYELGFTAEGRPFYAMELVRGETLDRRLSREGRVAWRDAVSLMIKACRAVEAAHQADLVHRDIKPANLMLTDEGGLKLLDFGVVKSEAELEPPRDGDGSALVVVGTPEYMAPEQARGQADVRSDVYALGAVLYELATGVLPHHASSAVALIELKLSAPLTPASVVAPDAGIPRALERLLARALCAEPEGRFDTVSDFRQALEELVDERVRARVVRRRAGAALVGALTLAAFLVVGARLSSALPGGLSNGLRVGRGLVEQALALDAKARKRAVPAAVAAAPVATASPAPEPKPASVPTFGEDTETTGAVVEATSVPVEPATSAAPAESTKAPERPLPPAVTAALAEVTDLERRGRHLKALHAIRQAAKEFPSEPAVLKVHVAKAQESKAWGEARRAALAWVKVDASAEARLSLARLERATGNSEKALALVESVMKSDKSPEAERLFATWSHDQRLASR